MEDMERAGSGMRKDARRNHERLLAEAKGLFIEQGIDAPLEQLATRAGVGAGTLYRHFPTRDRLVRELYDDAVERLGEVSARALGAASGWEAIERYIEDVAEWVIADPSLPALMRRMAEIDPAHRPGARLEAPTAELVARAQREGSLRDDVTGTDLAVLASMIGSVGQYGDGYVPHWRRQARIVLDGLRASGASPLPAPAQSADGFHRMVHGG